jgi:phosphotransferase system enzyme I (PtsP)
VTERFEQQLAVLRQAGAFSCPMSLRPDWQFDSALGERKLLEHLGAASLQAWGAHGLGEAHAAAAGLLAYAEHTQGRSLTHVHSVQVQRGDDLIDLPATTRDGVTIAMHMNAGLMADLPSLEGSGAEGVGLFRTELQFLIRNKMPQRGELAQLYTRVMDAAKGRPVAFRTLDIGSDKVLPYMKPQDEPNPAMGWRAIRVGLDKPGVLRMQVQALIRAANGRPLSIMFPFITEHAEFQEARSHVLREIHRERSLGHPVPSALEIGAMLETPSLAFAPQAFFELTDVNSIGGNDLKQFFFAADRENERVRKRYDSLNLSFLSFLEQIVQRCAASNTRLSFCGEDAGRPVEALAFAAMGLRGQSMRPASIGPVKALLRRVKLAEARAVIEEARAAGEMSARPRLMDWLASLPQSKGPLLPP